MATPRIHVDNIEELIDRRGRSLEWQEAVLCSCFNVDSGQPLYTCEACGGKGFVYRPAVVSKAIVTSVNLNQEWQEMAGMFEVGDAVMTVPKAFPIRNERNIPTGKSTDNLMFEIGVNDKVTLLDDEYKTSEVLIQGSPIGHRNADTLLNERITRIKSVSSFDTLTGIETKYYADVDYTLDINRFIWLPNGNSPGDFQQYSVTYFHRPTYVVIANLPKPRHQDGQDLPRYVALRYLSGAVDRK